MYYRAFFGTIAMLGLAALIGMFAVLSSPISPPSPAYAESNSQPAFSSARTPPGAWPRTRRPARPVGDPVTATDSDDDSLTYTLSGTDAASFAINASSGQLQTKTALDYETKSSYSVTVTATDLSGASDTINVTINVTNVDEKGTVTLSSPQPQVRTPLTAT